MPVKTINQFEIKYLQILDENGKCDEKLKPTLKPNEVKRIYESMLLSRTYDDRALKLQRQGRIGTFASLKGQEAIHVGAALAVKDSDWIVPSFRCEGVYITKGYPIANIFQVYGGDERGYLCPKDANITPFEITVGTQMLHACGIAWGIKLKKKYSGVVTFFGDGATSEGDFHEAMNFAGVFKLPVVFICQNNQWAISVPREKQTASETLAQKAIAYGFEGKQVDGNDVFSVYLSVRDAMDKARKGKGPTMIECITYRMSDHTTADDASKYRTKAEVKKWEEKDPIERLAKYMLKRKIADLEYFVKVRKKVDGYVDEAVKDYENLEPANPEDILNYTFENRTDNLTDQMEELRLRKELKSEQQQSST